MKLGSLFDGSGGFPLAGSLCGIEPVWAAEVEPYPIAVTRSRFPHMKHLGDVTKINGADIEPVDIITFGSPCQDLSVAGKRSGLKHESNGDDETTRSGLFMEAIRIIKEMRGATNGVYPRFAVWENVVGAFSSNGGEDFRIVLEEFTKIVEPSASMPAPEKGRWPYADCYVGDGWSVAYRTLDAQYWGVPQRRRRIYLVADFGGECAAEILFECEGMRGYFETGRTPWKETAGDAENCANAADRARCVAYSFDSLASNSMKSSNPHSGCRIVDTGKTLDASGPDPSKNQGGIAILQPVYCLQGNGIDRADTAGCNGKGVKEDVSYTLNTIDRPAVAYAIGNGQADNTGIHDVVGALNCMHDQQAVIIDRAFFNQGQNAQYDPQVYTDGTVPTIVAKGQSAVCVRYIVRRLTPTECARLQGFPDKWGHPVRKDDFSDAEYQFWQNVRNTYAAINGKVVKDYTKAQILTWYNKLHTDGAEYKMWGNGIALPCALYVMQGIQAVLNGGGAG